MDVDPNAVTGALQEASRPADARGNAAMQRRVEARLFDDEPSHETLGRFELHRVLGQGGGGTVYEARDPTLDRRVAIKVLLARDHASTQRGELTKTQSQALLREAQTLAKLTHPHCVRIYEVGEDEDRTFVVMELVEGTDLRAWRRGPGAKATVAQCLRILAGAGRGLQAAHELGIVHGDVKPANILLDAQHHPKLADFGLARIVDVDPAEGRHVVAGTPAYMAPEQHSGLAADRASDVFSYCATAHTILTGQHPYRAESFVALGRRKLEGPPAEGRDKMPGRVWRVLQRGMASDPSERPASITTVVDAFAPRRRRTALWVVSAVASTAIAAAVWTGTETKICEGTTRHLEGIWDDEARARAKATFSANTDPAARSAWAAVEGRLDQYAARWVQLQRESCEATHVHGEQSAALLDQRTACMHGKLATLRGVITVLEEVTPTSYADPASMVAGLRDLDACSAARVMSAPALSESPAAAAERWARMSAADTRLQLGRYEEAALELLELGQDAERAGNLVQASAAHRQRGVALGLTGDAKQAEQALRQAIVLAEREGLVDERVSAYVILARHVTRAFGRAQEALLLLDQAEAILQRPELSNHEIRPSYYGARSAALERTGDYRAALAYAQKAVSAFEDTHGESDFRVARALNLVSAAAMRLGELELARDALERALAIDLEHFGPDHPQLISDYINLGGVRIEQLEFEPGIEELERARRITMLNFPAGHRALGAIDANVASAHYARRDYDAAIESYRRVVAAFEGNDRLKAAKARLGIGNSLIGLGRHEQALPIVEGVLADQRELGAPARELALTQSALAQAHGAADPARARREAARARVALMALDPVPRSFVDELDAFVESLDPAR